MPAGTAPDWTRSAKSATLLGLTQTETISYEARLADGTLIARARTRDLVEIDAQFNGHRVHDVTIVEVPRWGHR